jgi:hypothetical protein
MDSILSRRRQHPQAEGGAEGQNDKSVDGREKAKTFSTQKLFLWVSYFACRFFFFSREM